ncbi:MAG: biotin--[acetyl-CoA-carboxylase] ligase [Desulfomonilaceae bacterium]|nr:biotin--[acetyl-CoA-carboxylase] ligase [Desulfomonilaceae bacterium]
MNISAGVESGLQEEQRAVTGRLVIYEEAESTQDLAKSMALSGEPEGTAVMALDQTRGRGRVGRSWVTPRGKNVALSVILRPRLSPRDAVLLGLLASVAVAEAIEEMGVPEAQLKWPNDVLVYDRKVAGILSEGIVSGSRMDFLIVGIGLNVNSTESDFPSDLRTPATSLLMCTGREWDLPEVARSILKHFAVLYDRVKSEGCGIVPPLWERRWRDRGKQLAHEGMVGIGKGLDADGALVLEQSNGSVVRINCGDVLPA